MSKYYLGIDIGGTKCTCNIVKDDGELHLLGRKQFPTVGTPEEVLETFDSHAAVLLKENGLKRSDVSAIGIDCGGPLDASRGVILSPPNLPGWDEIYVCKFFEERFGCPAKLENDADASGLAEWKFGAGKGTKNCIFLTFGTGLGAGIILNGALYRGCGGGAGEIGHVRLTDEGPEGYGKAGSCEGYCSGGGIRRMALAKLKEPGAALLWESAQKDEANVNAKLIASLAKSGDRFCLDIYNECGRMLGKTLSILIDLLNPEVIILGGIYMRSADLLIGAMTEELKRETLPRNLQNVRIVPALLGEAISDYAPIATLLTM